MSEPTTAPLVPPPDGFIAFARQHHRTLTTAGRSPEEAISAVKEIGAKCGYDVSGPPYVEYVVAESWKPAGGALSFADYDKYEAAAQAEMAVYNTTWRFKDIVNNIFVSDLPLAQKATLVEAAARDLRGRLAEDMEEPFERDGMKGQKTATSDVQHAGIADMVGSFTSFKDADDKWRWLAVHTNVFRDDEGERFSEKAHKEFVDYVDRTGDYPELWLWHVPGSAVGVADMIGFDDAGFMVSTGTYNPGMEHVAVNLKSLGPLGVSHGFNYREQDLVNGVYERYRSFEISPLPFASAANKITAFLAATEDPMLSQQKSAFLAQSLGTEFATKLESTLREAAASAKAKGLSGDDLVAAYKEITLEAVAPAAPAQTAPAAAPAATDAPAGTDAIEAAFTKALTPFVERLQLIEASVATATKDLSELKQTDDARIANLMTPRNPAPIAGFRATAQGQEATAAEVAAVKEQEAGQAPAHLREHFEMLGINVA